jgi:hypothetical protein
VLEEVINKLDETIRGRHAISQIFQDECDLLHECQELTVIWLLSQYSSQHCGVYTYILALAECSSSSNLSNRHRPLCPYSCPILLLFLVHNYLPLAHNLNEDLRLLYKREGPVFDGSRVKLLEDLFGVIFSFNGFFRWDRRITIVLILALAYEGEALRILLFSTFLR